MYPVENLFHERLLVREEGSGTREVLERCLDAQNFSIHDFEQSDGSRQSSDYQGVDKSRMRYYIFI